MEEVEVMEELGMEAIQLPVEDTVPRSVTVGVRGSSTLAAKRRRRTKDRVGMVEMEVVLVTVMELPALVTVLPLQPMELPLMAENRNIIYYLYKT